MENKIEFEIARIYEQYLSRKPDQEGLNHWLSLIKNGKLNIKDLPNIIKESEEFKNKHKSPVPINFFDHKRGRTELNEFIKKRGPVKVQNLTDIQLSVLSVLKSLNSENVLILDLGSNDRRLTPNVINVDIINPNNCTDFVLDICNDLPFEENTFDVVFCTAVLEHVAEPVKVVSEIHRVLCPEGIVWADIPFLQPLHRVPTDYQRYTIDGIRYLFRNFEEIDSGNANDIGTSIKWILDEFRKVILTKTNSEFLIKIFDNDWEKFEKELVEVAKDNNINASVDALNITGAVFFYGKKKVLI